MDRVVRFEVRDRIGWITLNRPEKLNAINDEMRKQLSLALRRCKEDRELGVVVIKGNGRAFSAGADLGNPSGEIKTPDEWRKIFQKESELFLEILNYPKVTIAACHGYVLGYAFFLMSTCDIIIATKSCKLGTPEVRHGQGVGRVIIPHNMRRNKAMETLLTGDLLSGAEAENIGLINKAVRDEVFSDEVLKLAKKLSYVDPLVLEINKKVINNWYDNSTYATKLSFGAYSDALLLSSNPSVKWMKLAAKVGMKEFLRKRDKPFADLEKK